MVACDSSMRYNMQKDFFMCQWGEQKGTELNHSKENRIQWHPACFAALNLEFLENRDDLEFLQEQTVNELPLRIDVLIIKKKQNHKIKNEIGEIFRWYNVIEYKSPDADLSFNTFLKGIAEIYLYKIKQEKTRIDGYSLSFIRVRKPVALFKVLKRANKELIEKMREENIMCKAMAEIFKPEIDAAVEAAVEATTVTVRENACNDKGMQVFKNMIKRGFSREDAQAMTEISDELVERALAEC